MASLGVQVVEDPLNEAGVHQQAFNLLAFEGTTGVRELVVDEESLAADIDGRLAVGCNQREGESQQGEGNRCAHGSSMTGAGGQVKPKPKRSERPFRRTARRPWFQCGRGQAR